MYRLTYFSYNLTLVLGIHHELIENRIFKLTPPLMTLYAFYAEATSMCHPIEITESKTDYVF